jgi:hypothetical protein
VAHPPKNFLSAEKNDAFWLVMTDVNTRPVGTGEVAIMAA